MEYPKIFFGKFCTMIRHEQSVWNLNSKLPYARPKLVRKKKIPVKIEKVLQAPIIFFSANWYRGVSLEPSYQRRINAVGSQSSLPPKKAKTQSSGGKRMATIFWAEEGILLIER
jgi:hypothetical protein